MSIVIILMIDDLLKVGNKDVSDLIKFAKLKLGNKYDFNIHKVFHVHHLMFIINKSKLFGRKFDYGSSPTFIIWTQPKSWYKSISFVNGEFLGLYDGKGIINDRLLLLLYVPMDELNEEGLAISVLLLSNKRYIKIIQI